MIKKIKIEKILLGHHPHQRNLLEVLKKVSDFFGYVSREDAEKIAQYFAIPLSKVFETASFYDLIKTQKQPSLVIKICQSANCSVGQSQLLVREIENHFKIKFGDEFNPNVKLELISCVGECARGPVVFLNGKKFTGVDKGMLYDILSQY